MTVTTTKDARILDTLREAVDTVSVGKVFGAPITQGETIVLPVARIGGGAGGGSGTGPAGPGQENGGTGGGLGMSAKPLGVFVLRDGKVGWRPAVDVNRIIMGGQIVAVTALLVVRAVIAARGGTTHRGARSLPGQRRAARLARRVLPRR
ncbi:spore germination protein GerW family protein [Actinoplanes sp. NPDC048967]|uniref:spore germination protein GerW family protein n=1 Tax=Actinoplanes sp. NPDC048967 TaxID=3155269 RepID=UPI0033D5BB8B